MSPSHRYVAPLRCMATSRPGLTCLRVLGPKTRTWHIAIIYLPVSFWGSQLSARPGRQSASMTGGSPARSQLCYVRYHMPGGGSTAQGRRRLPESPSSLQTHKNCMKNKINQREIQMNAGIMGNKRTNLALYLLLWRTLPTFFNSGVKKEYTDSFHSFFYFTFQKASKA